MTAAFLGEIQLFSGSYAPRGWAVCAGQTLSIASNTALFALLGTTFGGNGITTFQLPDLRGRVPLGTDTDPMGTRGGQEAVTLAVTQMPAHGHRLRGTSNAAVSDSPEDRTPAVGGSYAATQDKTIMGPVVVDNGSSQPHNNVAPSSTLLWCIALEGQFPS